MVWNAKFTQVGWFGDQKVIGYGDTAQRAIKDCIDRLADLNQKAHNKNSK